MAVRQTAANKRGTLSRGKKDKGVPAASPATSNAEANGKPAKRRVAGPVSPQSVVSCAGQAALPDASPSSADCEGNGQKCLSAAAGGAPGEAELPAIAARATAEVDKAGQVEAAQVEPAPVKSVAVAPSSPAAAGELLAAAVANGQGAAAAAVPCESKRLPITFSRIIEAPVEYHWRPFLPRAQSMLLVGDAGSGKSTFQAALAAMLTGGPALEGRPIVPPGRVLMFSPEQDASTMTSPRLRIAGADLGRVHGGELASDNRRLPRLQLPQDLGKLEKWIRELQVSGVFIDPITSCLGPGVEDTNGQHVREIMDGLQDIAASQGCLIQSTKHYRKSREGGPLQWVSGSSAWVEVPRLVLALGVDPHRPTQRVLVVPKNNNTQEFPSRLFHLQDVDGQPAFRIGTATALTAGDMTNTVETPAKRDTRAMARGWFKDLLTEGDFPAKTLTAKFRELGISSEIQSEVKVELGVTHHTIVTGNERSVVYRPPPEWPE